MRIIKIVLALILVALIFPGCRESRKKVPIILITLDTVRADHLSVYGYFRDTTPFLKDFSEQCVTFNQAYTSIPLTLPSHLGLFSSHYPIQHSIDTNYKALGKWRYPLLAEVLRGNKYKTCAIVASIVLKREFGLDRGFKTYQDSHFEQTIRIPVIKDGKEKVWEQKKRRAEDVVRRAKYWLEDDNHKDKKFFLWLHFWDAHTPYDLPPDYEREFADDAQFRKYLEDNAYLLPEDYPQVNEYDNSIRYLDEQLKNFFKYLDDEGILSKSLVIITADHGEGLGQHKWYKHGKHLYQGAVHIPLLIKFPNGRWAGKKIDSPVNLIDIAPTILDYLRIKDSLHSQGKSLLPLINDKVKDIRECEFLQRQGYKEKPEEEVNDWEPGKKYGALCGDWKIIYSTEAEPELYSLKSDPLELKNLAKDEPQKYADLKKKIDFYLSLEDRSLAGTAEVSEEMKKKLEALGYNQ